HTALSCSYIIGCPHDPLLFPYTTLFRSSLLLPAEAIPSPAGQPGQTKRRPAAESDRPPRGLRTRRESVLRVREQGHLPRPLDGADRKSTRLNSSHVKSSYAVFCLKKKTP